MPVYHIDNYIIEEDPVNILYHIRDILNNGKLKDIIIKKDELVVTCPNDEHDLGQESNPDCHINLKDDGDVPYLCTNCFACGSSGNFIKFVAQCFSSTYSYAKDWLIKNYGIMAYAKASIGEKINLNKNKKKVYLDEKILDSFQDYCPYLKQRKISAETCKLLNIKYDNKNKTVIFPCYDSTGKLVMLPTRSTQTKFFQLGADIEKPVYCIDQIIKNNIKTAIITEGPFDAATGWEYGFPTIATLGALSEHQINIINNSCITSLYAMFDNDSAGRAFTIELKKKLSPRILLHIVKIPDGFKDINDLDKETFWKILQEAKATKSI